MSDWKIITGDCREALHALDAGSVQTCVTSPPYWGLRDYGVEGQLGLEASPDEYVSRMVDVFREVRRVLTGDGTLWLNLGDSYAGNAGGGQGNAGALASRSVRHAREDIPSKGGFLLKPKDLAGIPWRVAFALQADGWYLRADIIWHKPNPMPESVTDRPTKAHEYLFLFAKSERYLYDAAAIAERAMRAGERVALGSHSLSRRSLCGGALSGGGNAYADSVTVAGLRNKRSVWTIATEPYDGSHFAVMPTALAAPCILAGSRPGHLVLDPFSGAGTTGLVALKHGRRYLGVELNPAYVAIAEQRLRNTTRALPLWDVPLEATCP